MKETASRIAERVASRAVRVGYEHISVTLGNLKSMLEAVSSELLDLDFSGIGVVLRQIKTLESKVDDTGWTGMTQGEFEKTLLDIGKVMSAAVRLQLEIANMRKAQENRGRNLSLELEGLMTRVDRWGKMLENGGTE